MAQTATTVDDVTTEAARLHDESIVFDMVSPLFPGAYPRSAEDYRAGGVTALGATVGDPQIGNPTNAIEGFRGVAHLYGLIRNAPDALMLIETVDDFARAKAAGKLGILLHFQTCSPFEQDERYVELFYRLGVRAALLTYNTRNFVADGCTERTDAGLSHFGVRVIKAMNRVGMVVDGSHTGIRSSLDAMEITDSPFIFSHSGAKAVYDHPRNLTNEQIKRCAQTGGVVGIVGLPVFVGDMEDPKVETLVRHAAHVAELVGVEHVGIGMDYYHLFSPYSTVEVQQNAYAELMRGDLWTEGSLPPPPWECAPGIETPAGMRNITAALLRHGFSYDETKAIMGENFLRVFRAVWKQ